jgi:hypothetical protein
MIDGGGAPKVRTVDDSERRDAVRYAIVRRMKPSFYVKLCLLAEVERRSVDDLIEEMSLEFLGRTFEQELHRLASLDLAEATFAGGPEE